MNPHTCESGLLKTRVVREELLRTDETVADGHDTPTSHEREAGRGAA